MEKTCSSCKEIKELDDFFKLSASKDGHYPKCKKCCSKYWLKPKVEVEEGYKICTKCKKTKSIQEFSKKHTLKSGLCSSCKECTKEYRKEPKTAENYKKYREEYLKTNKEKVRITSKQWEKDNKEKRKKQKYLYRQANKHIFAWKSVLRNTVKRIGTTKNGHTIDILGYSALELKENMLKKFTEGMSWNNYGEWHIDHIKPVISFDKETSVSIVCSLDNLQPLWASTKEIDGTIYKGNLNKGKY